MHITVFIDALLLVTSSLRKRCFHPVVTLCVKKGVYIDLGTVQQPDEEDNIALNSDTALDFPSSLEEESLKEWRNKHWIVLVDDESSIRLAIGDYLYSMGYNVVTACDGPISLFEILLYTCGWSFLGEDSNIASGLDNNQCPPWLEDSYRFDKHPWRLPSIIISDIRMPGGIDGVQLLELLRERYSSMEELPVSVSPIDPKQTKKKRRSKKSQLELPIDESYTDGELPNPKVFEGWVEFATPIATPFDHARKVLGAIHNTVEYCKKVSSSQRHPDKIQDIPVILLTAKAMVSDRIKGYKAGAAGYLPKPFRPEELLRMVDNLMRRQDRERSASLQNTNNSGDSISDQVLSFEEMEEITKEVSEIKKLLQDVTS